MAIRNIDAQIMLQRTTDVAREASILQRQPTAAQEHAAAQNKADSALAQKKVQSAPEVVMENIRPDADGGGLGAAGSGAGEGSDEEEVVAEDIDDDLLLPPSDEIHIIDMIV